MSLGLARTAAAVLVLCLVSACTGGSAPGGGEDAPGPDASEETNAERAGELRLQLERAVGRLTLLSLEAARSVALEDSDAEAIAGWTDDAVAQMEAALNELEPTAGEDVADQWRDLNGLLLEYAEALATEDGDTEAAAGELEHAATELGTALAELTDERWDSEEAGEALRIHVQNVARYAEAHRNDNHKRAMIGARHEHARMVSVAQTWALGLADRHDLAGSPEAGRVELRSALNQLFGEHATLLTATTRRVLDDTDDLDATAAALNGNTQDLVTALAAVFNADVADDFDPLWRRHVELLIVDALSDDPQKQRETRTELRSQADEIAGVLATAADGLEEEAMISALQGLQQAVQRHTRAAAEDRLGRAGRQSATAFEAAGQVADALGAAVADARPQDYPDQ